MSRSSSVHSRLTSRPWPNSTHEKLLFPAAAVGNSSNSSRETGPGATRTGGGGFWVVAIVGAYVARYNDIEYGFNSSRYSEVGPIDEYWCNQDELEHTIQSLLTRIQTGQRIDGQASPPGSGSCQCT